MKNHDKHDYYVWLGKTRIPSGHNPSIAFVFKEPNILAMTAITGCVEFTQWHLIVQPSHCLTGNWSTQRSVLIFPLLLCSILPLGTRSLLHLLKCIWAQEMSLCVPRRKSKVLGKERWINQGWGEKERDGGRRQKERCIDRKTGTWWVKQKRGECAQTTKNREDEML